MRRVVVTGMGVVSPVGSKLETFWDSLVNGKSGIGLITRFDTTDFKVKVAAEVKDFDASEYMDKNEVRRSDIFVRYAIGAADQAVKHSGIMGNIAPDRFGVYFGSGVGGFETFVSEQENFNKRGPSRVSPLFITKMISNMGAGNIAIRFNAKGPCISFTTACATGSTSLGEAFRAIRHGYADAIIAGGVDASITPLAIAGFQNCTALCENDDVNAASIPFDKRRSGFVMGEGAGALILEEYEHAKARGAVIYAEMVGYGSTCDAHHVTAPDSSAEASSKAILDCYKEACEDVPADKIYINAHGTSTHLNDLTETTAFKRAFGDAAYDLSISSTKSMTGHLLGAAGAVEAIAAVMAIKDGIIPPTINYVEPDEECDLNYTPNHAVHKDIELALSTSLGFGGHNACVGFRKVSEE